jgi:hypothetical protein
VYVDDPDGNIVEIRNYDAGGHSSPLGHVDDGGRAAEVERDSISRWCQPGGHDAGASCFLTRSRNVLGGIVGSTGWARDPNGLQPHSRRSRDRPEQQHRTTGRDGTARTPNGIDVVVAGGGVHDGDDDQ